MSGIARIAIDEGPGETRAVGRDILKNRGLTRERKTADRCARHALQPWAWPWP